MDKINLGDIYKFRTGEIGMVISEKPDYYSVLCEDGKISNVRKGIPYTFIDLDNETSSIYKEYKDYLFEKASILKRIELENEKLFQVNNTLTDIQLRLRLKGSKYSISEFIDRVLDSLDKKLLKELDGKCRIDMTYHSGCFRVEIYQEKCISSPDEYNGEYMDIVVPENIGGTETGNWELNVKEYNIPNLCKSIYLGDKDIVKLNNSVNMQNVMVYEEKDIFVYGKDAYFYNSIVYRFRASKLTDDLIETIKKTIVKK